MKQILSIFLKDFRIQDNNIFNLFLYESRIIYIQIYHISSMIVNEYKDIHLLE